MNGLKGRQSVVDDHHFRLFQQQGRTCVVKLSFGSCQEIQTKRLEMIRVAAKFVPRLVIEEQKQH